MKKIFISYSTPVNKNQMLFLENLKKFVNELGYEYIMVANETQNPFFKIKDKIAECCGLICLAFVKNSRGLLKKTFYTSKWLDVELALALTLNVKTLVFSDRRIEDTCLISKKNCVVQTFLMSVWDFNTSIIKNYLKEWIKTI